MIGSADDHRIDFFPREYLPVISCREDLRSVDLFHVLQPAVIAVACCHKLGETGSDGTLGIALAHATAADQCDLNLVISRDLMRRGRLPGQQRHTYTCPGGSEEMSSRC